MANYSLSIGRGGAIDKLGQSGAQSVTVGTLAPGAGDIEIRLSNSNGLTKLEAKNLADVLWRYFELPTATNPFAV